MKDEIDTIFEILHNSWLEDDFEYDDPDYLHAKQAILTLKKKWETEAVERYKRQDYEKAVFNKDTYDLISSINQLNGDK